MSIRQSFKLARAPMAGLGMVGVAWGTFSGVVPDLQITTGVTKGQLGTVLMFSALGSMSAMFLSPRFYARAGRWTLPLAGLGLIIALNLPALATNMVQFATVMILVGATVGMLDITSNIRISAIEARHNASLMNISHSIFSFAFGIGALITGFLREAGYSPIQITPILALAAAGIWLLTREPQSEFDEPVEEEASATGKAGTSPHFWMVVALTAIILFSSFIGENSTEAWSALHIERTLGAEAGVGAYGPAALGIVMGLARFFGQIVADRVGERMLIGVSAALGALGAIALAFAPSVFVAITSVAVIAIGMSLIVPSANTVLGRRVPDKARPLALSRAWMVGMTGFFIGPAMMGFLAETFSLRVAFGIVACIIALIIPAIIGLGRIPRPERAS